MGGLLGLLIKLMLDIPTHNAHKKNHRRVLEPGLVVALTVFSESHAESAAKRGKVLVVDDGDGGRCYGLGFGKGIL